MSTIAIIAAHPDDEVLGCGGTMARHAAAGDQVYVIFLADGVTSRQADENDIRARMDAANRAARALGAKPPVFLGLPDNRLDSVDLLDVVQKLEQHLEDIQPEIIYTHSATDLNIDHRITHQAVLTACRPQPGSMVRAIYAFEVLSSTHWSSYTMTGSFSPIYFIDITGYITHKMKALECYQMELRSSPHARSIEAVLALAEFRGSLAGVRMAESFEIIREIAKW